MFISWISLNASRKSVCLQAGELCSTLFLQNVWKLYWSICIFVSSIVRWKERSQTTFLTWSSDVNETSLSLEGGNMHMVWVRSTAKLFQFSINYMGNETAQHCLLIGLPEDHTSYRIYWALLYTEAFNPRYMIFGKRVRRYFLSLTCWA